jgi:hypothetical protein
MPLNTQRARRARARLATGAVAGLTACLLSSAVAQAATTRLAGTDAVGTHVSSASPGNAEAYKTAGTATGDTTSISVHLDASTTTTAVEVGVYSDDRGRPATLLTSARSNAPVAGWNEIAVPSTRLESGTPYWIAVLNPDDATGTLAWTDRAGGTGGEEQTSGSSELTTLPDEWVVGRNFSDGPLSAYVTGDEHVPPGPTLAVTPSALSFWSTASAGSPAPKTLNIANSGDGSFTYTASETTPWLTVTPASGSAPGSVTVTVNTAGLAAGTYNGSVTITALDAADSPHEVPVTLTVNPARTANGLVGAWAFEETSGDSALDSSGRRNTGTLQGPSRTASGMYGRGLVFDGDDDWVTIADSASLDLRTGMTLEAWVKPDALADVWRTVLIKEQTGRLAYALYANTDAGGPSSHVYTDRDNGVAAPNRLPQGVWSHVATTWDGSTLRVFVNGGEVASMPLDGEIATSSGALRIGGNAIWSEWFDGQIDEVRVYDRALSPAEILADRDTRIDKGSGSEMSPLEKLKALLLKLLARWKEHRGNWSWHDWHGGHFKGR